MQEFLLKLNFKNEKKNEEQICLNLHDHFLHPSDLKSFSEDEDLFSYICFTDNLYGKDLSYENSEYLVISSLSDETINNFKNLKPKLGFIKNPSELALKFYLSFPLDLFKNISGGFCFIVFDKKKRKIFCIRDQHGMKNLFYSIGENAVYFSTRLSFLVSQKDIKKTINIQTLADFLELSKNCKSSTFYNEINKLPNACFLKKNRSNFEISHYDQLEAKINNLDLKETSKKLRNLIENLFDRKLNKNKNVGVMFSGGLDSSTVLAMLSNKKKHSDVLAISSIFENIDSSYNKGADESFFQKKLLLDKKVKHQTFEGNDHSTLRDIDEYLKIIGEPFFFPNAYIPFNCFKIAKQNNINIVFNGNDGDTVISHGYELLVELFFSFKWVALYKELSNISKVKKMNRRFIFRRIVIGRFFNQLVIFLIFHIKNFFKLNQNFTINSLFSNESEFFKRNKPKLPLIDAAKNHLQVLNQNLQFEAIEKQGAMASYVGIEESYPFYDIELIKYCLSINPRFKLMNGMQRFILRDSMKDLLPKEIFERTDKSQFSSILHNDFLKKSEPLISQSIENPNKFLLKRIDKENLLKVWRKIKTNKSHVNSNELSVIFAFVVVNRWLNNEKFN